MDNIQKIISESKKLSENGYYNKALILIEKALHINPNYYELHMEQGYLYSFIKEQKKAIDALSRAIALSDKTIISLYFRRADYQLGKGLYNGAIDDFSVVINSNNEYYKYSAYNMRAMAFVYIEEYQSALKDFNALPDDYDIGLLFKKGNFNYLTKGELFYRINFGINKEKNKIFKFE